MPIEFQLKRIIIDELSEDQVIVLAEVYGPRSLPIVVGLFEATSIDRRVKHFTIPRPLTHDLIIASIEELGGVLKDVTICDLREKTYFAVLRVQYNGESREFDCRPSDAVAVAVIAKLPIYINESILGD